MQVFEMIDLKAWAKLTKLIQQAKPKPPVPAKPKLKSAATDKLTDFERNTNRLRSEVARLKAKSPIPPVSLRT